MRLRDHDQPCEHGRQISHWPEDDTTAPMCPGGAEIEIDYVAAAVALSEEAARPWPMDLTVPAKAIVDAALRIGENE